VDVFQGLPSNSVLLSLTSWENQNKSAKTSEKKLVDLHKSGSSLRAISKRLEVPHSSVQTIVCTMGPRSHHTFRRLISYHFQDGVAVQTSFVRPPVYFCIFRLFVYISISISISFSFSFKLYLPVICLTQCDTEPLLFKHFRPYSKNHLAIRSQPAN
jgi:hypothetical protein